MFTRRAFTRVLATGKARPARITQRSCTNVARGAAGRRGVDYDSTMGQARYLKLTALLLLATVATAHAQPVSAPAGNPPPSTTAGPESGATPDPSAASGGTSSPAENPPLRSDAAVSPAPPSAFATEPALPIRSAVPPLSPLVHHRYRAGRVVYTVGNVLSFTGNSLTLASIIVSAVYGLGLDQSEDKITGRIGPGLAYAGASATGAGFIMIATGLGLQHSALALVGQDPGRGMYGAGTALGILGLCGIGTSYFFALTKFGGDSSTIAAFSASVAAGTLLTIGSILYLSDSLRIQKAYRRLTTF